MSIRATCRITGFAKGTVLKFLAEMGEATDAELRECYYGTNGSRTYCLRAVYNLGRTHGENRVCARLPRLLGLWRQDSGQWLSLENSPLLAWCPDALPITSLSCWKVREFDHRTGGPKG